MIAPHELKNKAFNKVVRGYNTAEVDEYIEFIIDKYTEVYRKNSELENELRTTKVKYSELHHDEDTIRAVIVKAQKLGENIVEQAKAEAEKIISGAKAKCMERVEEAEKAISDSKEELAKTKAATEDFRNSLYQQYLEHIKMLKALNFNVTEVSSDGLRDTVESTVDEDTANAKDKILKFTEDSE